MATAGVALLVVACGADSGSPPSTDAPGGGPGSEAGSGGGTGDLDGGADGARGNPGQDGGGDAAVEGGPTRDGGKDAAGDASGDASTGTTYSTTFPLTENPVSEGGKWIAGKAVGLDWNDPRTTPGEAFASVLSGNPSRYNDSIAHLTTAFAADQFAEGSVFRAAGYDPSPSKHEVELLLRFKITAHSARGYEVMWGATGYLAVVRWNGPLGDYTTLYDPGDPGIGPAADGDVLRAEIKGTIITVHKGATSVATIDVTSQGGQVWSDGQPGMGFWPVDGATPANYGWKSYQAGTL